MAVRNLPGLGLTGGYATGQNGWGGAMNNNLEKLSAVVQLVVESSTQPIGTVLTADGQMTIAPFASGEDWRIVMLDEGLYRYVDPQIGWRAYIKDIRAYATYMGPGINWFIEPVPRSIHGAHMTDHVVSEEVELLSGAEVLTSIAIPTIGSVLAVSTQVLEDITGPTALNVGVVGAPTQYGNALPLLEGTTHTGQTYSPVTYAYGGPVPIILAGVGGDFTGGKVRVTIFAKSLVLPPL